MKEPHLCFHFPYRGQSWQGICNGFSGKLYNSTRCLVVRSCEGGLGMTRRKLSRPRSRRALISAITPACCEMLENRRLLSITITGVPNWVAEGPGPVTDGGTSATGGNVLGPTAATSLKDGGINEIAVDPANSKHLLVATIN